MSRTLLALHLVMVFSPALTSDESDPAARLEARGIKLKKEKGGTVTEVGVGPTVSMTLDDYRRIGRLKGLKRVSLNAQELPLNDMTLAALGPLDTVDHFFANGAQLTEDGFKALARWKNLKSLGLDHWGWFKAPSGKTVFGKELAHLATLPGLESIRLGGCRVDNEATAALAKIKTLEKVDLFHTYGVTDDGIAALAALPRLRLVKLGPQYAPRITDRSLEHLGKIPTLEEIEVSETWLTYHAGFRHLKGLLNLKVVRLKDVAATEGDIARLKADYPRTTVEWTQPDADTTARLKDRFEKARVKEKKY